MKTLKFVLAYILCSPLSYFTSFAQDELKYENHIYEKNIKTVLLRQSNSTNNLGLMSLGQTNALNLIFDEMGSTEDYYNYTFIHCSYDWTPSNLQKQNYKSGECEESKMTTQHNSIEQSKQDKTRTNKPCSQIR